HVEVHAKPAVSPTNVLVEMQPGNIVVYKFVDESSGKVIQQIPSEQMLNLSEAVESNEKSKKQKQRTAHRHGDLLFIFNFECVKLVAQHRHRHRRHRDS